MAFGDNQPDTRIGQTEANNVNEASHQSPLSTQPHLVEPMSTREIPPSVALDTIEAVEY